MAFVRLLHQRGYEVFLLVHPLVVVPDGFLLDLQLVFRSDVRSPNLPSIHHLCLSDPDQAVPAYVVDPLLPEVLPVPLHRLIELAKLLIGGAR